MTSASLALTRALIAALKADAVIGAHGVYHAPPPGTRVPYVTVGPDLVSDWSTKSGPRREHRLQVIAWDAPLASASCAAILARVETVVGALATALDGHTLVSTLFVRSFVAAEGPAGPTKGLIEFRARTQAVVPVVVPAVPKN